MILGKISYLLTFFIIFSILIETISILAQENATYIAELDGSHVSTKVNTNATGIAKFIFYQDLRDPSKDQLMYNVNVSKIKDVTLIKLFSGSEGFNGPDVVKLPQTVNYEKTGILATGNLTTNDKFMNEIGGKGEYALEVLKDYLDSHRVYIVIYTKEYPEGEIRGQIHRIS